MLVNRLPAIYERMVRRYCVGGWAIPVGMVTVHNAEEAQELWAESTSAERYEMLQRISYADDFRRSHKRLFTKKRCERQRYHSEFVFWQLGENAGFRDPLPALAVG